MTASSMRSGSGRHCDGRSQFTTLFVFMIAGAIDLCATLLAQRSKAYKILSAMYEKAQVPAMA